MKFFFLPFIFVFLSLYSFATHNRGGEITYRYLSGFTYEIKIITYTKTSGISLQADRPVLDSVHFGDGTTSSFIRMSIIDNVSVNDPANVRQNIYINTHTYPGEGLYAIFFEDPNRNAGLLNIPTSVNVPFSIRTDIAVFDPQIHCINNSAIPGSLPIFVSQVMKNYVHNMAAYDPDGDSLSFELIPCNGSGGVPIPGYFFPPGMTINPINGEINWSSNTTGEYNIAVKISEWRKQIKIACVTRDFQIINTSLSDTAYHFGNTNGIPVDTGGNFSMHVNPGDTISQSFYFEDVNATDVSVNVFTKIYASNPPTITIDSTIVYRDSVTFYWIPDSSQISNTPHLFVFRGLTTATVPAISRDLSLMIFVDGIVTDTCSSFADPYFVNELSGLNPHVTIYPNPVKENMTILWNGPDGCYQIHDVAGKLLMIGTFATPASGLDVSKLTSGIYFLTIFDKKQRVHSKFVKD